MHPRKSITCSASQAFYKTFPCMKVWIPRCNHLGNNDFTFIFYFLPQEAACFSQPLCCYPLYPQYNYPKRKYLSNLLTACNGYPVGARLQLIREPAGMSAQLNTFAFVAILSALVSLTASIA